MIRGDEIKSLDHRYVKMNSLFNESLAHYLETLPLGERSSILNHVGRPVQQLSRIRHRYSPEMLSHLTENPRDYPLAVDYVDATRADISDQSLLELVRSRVPVEWGTLHYVKASTQFDRVSYESLGLWDRFTYTRVNASAIRAFSPGSMRKVYNPATGPYSIVNMMNSAARANHAGMNRMREMKEPG